MKIPPYEESYRCLELRKKSKRGGELTDEEHEFCNKMFKKFKAWYSETEKVVFNETVPYGSNVRIE